MCKRNIFILITCLFTFYGWSQQQVDTTYYDAHNKRVAHKSQARTYKTNIRTGIYEVETKYTIDDVKISETNYMQVWDTKERDSVMWWHGTYREWHSLGQLKTEANYNMGRLDKDLKTYYINGKLRRHDIYDNDSLTIGKCFNNKGEPVNYFPYMVQPEYPKGQAALFNFLSDNIKYPKKARINGIEGTVYVGFVVDVDGEIIDVDIKRGVHSTINSEAVRVVKMMPPWKPGQIDGEYVRVPYTLPVKFRLE